MLERTQSEMKMELKNPTAQLENKEELQVELQVLQVESVKQKIEYQNSNIKKRIWTKQKKRKRKSLKHRKGTYKECRTSPKDQMFELWA